MFVSVGLYLKSEPVIEKGEQIVNLQERAKMSSLAPGELQRYLGPTYLPKDIEIYSFLLSILLTLFQNQGFFSTQPQFGHIEFGAFCIGDTVLSYRPAPLFIGSPNELGTDLLAH